MEPSSTALSDASARVARFLAGRTTRRSLLARVGQGSIVVAMGGGAALRLADVAYADGGCNCGACPSCGSCTANSATCNCAFGINTCTNGSCIGGCWWESWSGCQSGIREWCDCVSGCDNPCTCVNCSTGQHPRCCRHKTYSSRSQCGNGCNHIRCRRWTCIGSTFTVTTC